MDTLATIAEDSPKQPKNPRQFQNVIEKTRVCIHFHVKQQMCRPPPDYYDGAGLRARSKTAMCGGPEGGKGASVGRRTKPTFKNKKAFLKQHLKTFNYLFIREVRYSPDICIAVLSFCIVPGRKRSSSLCYSFRLQLGRLQGSSRVGCCCCWLTAFCQHLTASSHQGCLQRRGSPATSPKSAVLFGRLCIM